MSKLGAKMKFLPIKKPYHNWRDYEELMERWREEIIKSLRVPKYILDGEEDANRPEGIQPSEEASGQAEDGGGQGGGGVGTTHGETEEGVLLLDDRRGGGDVGSDEGGTGGGRGELRRGAGEIQEEVERQIVRENNRFRQLVLRSLHTLLGNK